MKELLTGESLNKIMEGTAMVRIKPDEEAGVVAIGNFNVQMESEQLEQMYIENQRRNIGFAVIESVPTGDPPAIILWGDE